MSVEATGAPLRVSELSLKKKEHFLLSNINFVLDHSEIMGIVSNRIEPVNYLFRILLFLEKPSSGSIVYFNNPMIRRKELIKKIGFYSCQMDLFEKSTLLENLMLSAFMHGLNKEKALARSKEILSLFEASNLASTKWFRLPVSLKRKLCFASAFIHDPSVILLYDPFRGVPFDVAMFMRNFIRTSIDLGKSMIVFSTTPLLLDETCDRIMVLHNGQQAAMDHVDSFVTGVGGPGTLSIHVSKFNIEANIDSLEKMGVSWYATGENEAIIELDNTPEKVHRVLEFLVKKGAIINRIVSSRQHLLESANRFMEV
ncbi:MAG: ATP-binding cassette domain-containing protein [Crenarchaeota archaeon]|nr:ATP-binding cassette domain-containing protein [Thermoproteota archaeon]MDW8033902.1 ATP-binding cassette domain-containing protein [Nitrososphaerota archaeon]